MELQLSGHMKKEENRGVHPKKFNLWLLIISICMLFAGFTSAYIVRSAEGNWFEFELPQMFLYSTVFVVLSSVSMFWAYRSAKQDELGHMRAGLWSTLVLGIAFCVSQFMGYADMVDRGLYFSEVGDRISASFVYVISGMHLLHLIGGILFLLYVVIKAHGYGVHKKRLLSINMCNTYWHFVGILWVYLYLFLYFAHQ